MGPERYTFLGLQTEKQPGTVRLDLSAKSKLSSASHRPAQSFEARFQALPAVVVVKNAMPVDLRARDRDLDVHVRKQA